jgi:hypothetical protein
MMSDQKIKEQIVPLTSSFVRVDDNSNYNKLNFVITNQTPISRKTGRQFSQSPVSLSKAMDNVTLFTDEDKEAYKSEINMERLKVVYPKNPCLFTQSIKIHNYNKKIEQMK